MNSTRAFFIAAAICTRVFAGAALTTAPVPADPHEPITGRVQSSATPADRAAALSILERARQNSKLHMPNTPSYRMVVTFNAAGNVAQVGSGELTETWQNGQKWRWTAQLGGTSVVRVANVGRRVAGNNVATAPMRVHMLRNAIFWAARPAPSNAHLRTAEIQVNGKAATCVLVSFGSAGDGPSRAWNEEEYCVDKASGVLVSYSEAPGVYTVYGFANAIQFHDQVMPDHITIYVGGVKAVDANFSITDIGTVDDALFRPTPEMLAAGPPPGLELPGKLSFSAPSPLGGNSIQPVIVHAQIDGEGKVTDVEACTAAEPSLVQSALDMVAKRDFGRSGSQRQTYVEVKFVPTAQ